MQQKLRDLITDTAEKHKIPFQRSALSRATGTDTDAFAYSNGGVASALISLPLRYMHTTVEMVHQDDVENVIKLIYESLLTIKTERLLVILTNKQAEYIDIVTADGAPTGKVALKDEAHQNGWYHNTIHLWLYTKHGEILLQQRSHKNRYFHYFGMYPHQDILMRANLLKQQLSGKLTKN